MSMSWYLLDQLGTLSHNDTHILSLRGSTSVTSLPQAEGYVFFFPEKATETGMWSSSLVL